MQPLRRGRILWLGACSKAFARARKRPGNELSALIRRLPAALDLANVGLHVVDVVRNEIIHCDHHHMPRAPSGNSNIARSNGLPSLPKFAREGEVGRGALRWN
jgi:hypothetical protein